MLLQYSFLHMWKKNKTTQLETGYLLNAKAATPGLIQDIRKPKPLFLIQDVRKSKPLFFMGIGECLVVLSSGFRGFEPEFTRTSGDSRYQLQSTMCTSSAIQLSDMADHFLLK